MQEVNFDRLLTDARLRACALAMAIRGHFSNASDDDSKVLEALASDCVKNFDELSRAAATVTIVLIAMGEQKIEVIKQVRAVMGLSLVEAKDLVEAVPIILKHGVPKAAANEIKDALEAVGAGVLLV